MIDLTTPLDELGLSDETLTTLGAVETICLEQHIKINGGRPPACIAPSTPVSDVLEQLLTIRGRRHIYSMVGRAPYAELVAELDDHRLLPKRWGLGVEPWTPRTYTRVPV